MTLEIKDVTFTTQQGHAVIRASINGSPAHIPLEQKAREYDLIFLGLDDTGAVSKTTLPADRANGRPEPQTLEGFSNDPQIVKLYEFFRQSIEDDTFREGRVDLGKL